MSTIDFRSKRTDKNKATKLIREIVEKRVQNIHFSSHASEAMQDDNLAINDIINVLESTSSRILMEGELKNGSYRYQYGTKQVVVVVAFWPKGNGMVIVTVWRKG